MTEQIWKKKVRRKERKNKRKALLCLRGTSRPPSSKRFCKLCNKMRIFRYNKLIGHSECTFCGSRMIDHDRSLKGGKNYK